jgi:predicted RNA-binding Zn-ribbon protein involved in translation (DUF1610 family)
MNNNSKVIGVCYVCRGAAQFLPTSADAHHITCPVCGEFQISDTWATIFQNKNEPVAYRREKLAEAKKLAGPGTMPFIGPNILA